MGLPEPSYQDNLCTLYHGDALQLMPELPAASVQLIIADVPYFKQKLDYLGKRVEWDRQWKTRADYLAWLRQMAQEWKRVLAPNGSLYCFAAPDMAAHVEVMLEDYFTVLNRITWLKENGWHQKAEKETLRSYLSPWEAILFCEQGSNLYAERIQTLHQQIYKPVGNYIKQHREAAGYSTGDVEKACAPSRQVTRLCYRWEQGDCLPTITQFLEFMKFVGDQRTDEALRTEYEALRTEYEALRRPFTVSPAVPYTDVWSFNTVAAGPGKHAAEKPLPLLRHIIEVSSRPGDLVFDPCTGSGSTLEAARQCGRRVIGFELEASSIHLARQRLCQQSLPWEDA
jgi:adenine-specific DNA-methyltransferase